MPVQSSGEVHKLLSACNENIRTVVTVLVGTGIRSTRLHLMWTDTDLQHCLIPVHRDGVAPRSQAVKLSRTLGHSSVAITQQVYAHLHPEASPRTNSRFAFRYALRHWCRRQAVSFSSLSFGCGHVLAAEHRHKVHSR